MGTETRNKKPSKSIYLKISEHKNQIVLTIHMVTERSDPAQERASRGIRKPRDLANSQKLSKIPEDFPSRKVSVRGDTRRNSAPVGKCKLASVGKHRTASKRNFEVPGMSDYQRESVSGRLQRRSSQPM